MASLHTISSGMAKELQAACALRGVGIVGVPGGWTVLLKVGMTEKRLGTQRGGRVRCWRSLDTLVDYLRSELGIVRIDGIDASAHNPASVHSTRPDVAGRMRQAHGLVERLTRGDAMMAPVSAEPRPSEGTGFAERLMAMPNVGQDSDFARRRRADIETAIDDGHD